MCGCEVPELYSFINIDQDRGESEITEYWELRLTH